MRPFAQTHTHSFPPLAWLVTLFAAFALLVVPGVAIGAGEEVCDPNGLEECASSTIVVAVPNEAAPPEVPPTLDPDVGVSTTPPVGETIPIEPTPVPDPRIDPGTPPVVEPVEPPVVLEEPAPAEPAPTPVVLPPVEPPTTVQLAPDAVPNQSGGFVGNVSDPAPAAPDVAPSLPAPPAPLAPVSRPDAISLVVADAPPPAEKASPLAPPAYKPSLDASAFTDAGGTPFAGGLDGAAAGLSETVSGIVEAVESTLLVEQLFSTSNEWIPAAASSPSNLIEVLATYLVPGDGGSYTATLAALLQLAFVLVAWMLIRPRPVSSSVSLLQASQRAGYRAVALRPG